MEGSAQQFGLYLLLWIVYFLIVFFGCTFFYMKRLKKLPVPGVVDSRLGKQKTLTQAQWDEIDRVLRKRMFQVGLVLMLVPLLLPILVRFLQ